VNICNSEVYKWADKDGNINITDYPRPVYPNEVIEKNSAPYPPSSPNKAAVKRSRSLKQLNPVKSLVEPAKSTDHLTVTLAPEKPSAPQQLKAQDIKPAAQAEQKIGHPEILSIAPTDQKYPEILPTKALTQVKPALPLIRMPNQRDFGIKQDIILGILLLSILYFLYTLFSIAKKLQIDKPWMALIPIANAYTIIKAADKPKWWLALLFVPVANIGIGVIVWMAIYERLGLERKNGFSTLYLSPIVIPVVAVLFSLFNPTGIILSILFIIYPAAILFCGSMLILPGYYLRLANLITDKEEVSKIFETKSLIDSEHVPETPKTYEEYPQEISPVNDGASVTPETSEEYPQEISPVIDDTSVTTEIFEEPTPNISAVSEDAVDISKSEPPAEILEQPSTNDEQALTSVEQTTEDNPEEQEPMDISTLKPVTPETANLEYDTMPLIKNTEDLDTNPVEQADEEIISMENKTDDNVGYISFDYDLNAQPAGIAYVSAPIIENIEGISVDFDLEVQPVGIAYVSAPIIENIEGISVDIYLEAAKVSTTNSLDDSRVYTETDKIKPDDENEIIAEIDEDDTVIVEPDLGDNINDKGISKR
jgi:hypothetical protein